MKQQTIKVPEPKADTRSLHQIRLDVLNEFGPRKHEALIEQLGASKGHFSEVLSGKKHWPDDWTDYIADHFDVRSEIAAYFARKRGLVLRPPRQRSAAENLRRLRYVLTNHNGLGKAIAEEADALADDVFADEDAE